MDNEIFMINEDNGYSLILNTDKYDNYWYIELLDTAQKVIFHYRCDTFLTGNLILHLQHAIKKFSKNYNRILLSRWYPNTDRRFLMSIAGPTYITPCIYKDEEDRKSYMKFIVVVKNIKEPITFQIPLSRVKDRI